MSPDGQEVLCLEPRIDGPRHSGGFFYNDCLAAAAVACSQDRAGMASPGQPRFSIKAWDGGRLPSAFVLLDSLWWYVHRRPLDVLSAALAGRSWGIIMHGMPDESSGLLGDMAGASFVVVPSFWAAGQLEAVRSRVSASGRLDVRVLYPGWNGRPGLVAVSSRQFQPEGTAQDATLTPGSTPQGDSPHVRIASSSNWTRAKGLVEAACVLGSLSRNPSCPPWIWQAAGTIDAELKEAALSGLGSLASRLQPLGHLDPAALVRLLHNTDIFLHPSTQETFCLSVFEAALAGCRVVARAIGGVPEAIHLANLLRSQLGLPPAGVHLAAPDAYVLPAGVRPAPSGLEGGPDTLCHALDSALAAMVDPARYTGFFATGGNEPNRGDPAGFMEYPDPPVLQGAGGTKAKGHRPLRAIQAGLLYEFSWQGRLEKLLKGLSDSPLPSIIGPEQVEQA